MEKNVEQQPIETILLFDERQLLYFKQHGHRREFAMIFRTKPYIEWFVRNKTPELSGWVDSVLEEYEGEPTPAAEAIREMERALICSMEDWVIYVTTPDDYHNQPFVSWNERELTELTDYSGKTVVDIGSGTGKQAFAVAHLPGMFIVLNPFQIFADICGNVRQAKAGIMFTSRSFASLKELQSKAV